MITDVTSSTVSTLIKELLAESVAADSDRKSAADAELEGLGMSDENLLLLQALKSKTAGRSREALAPSATDTWKEFTEEITKRQEKRGLGDRPPPAQLPTPPPQGAPNRQRAMVDVVSKIISQLKEQAVIPYDEGVE